MLVTAVGMNTTWGQMMSTIVLHIEEETPLQTRLNKLTSCVNKVILATALPIFVVSRVRHDIENHEFNGRKTKENDMSNAMADYIAQKG